MLTSLTRNYASAAVQGGISSSILSVFFTDKFALSQSDARISVAYKNLSVKNTDKTLDEMPPWPQLAS